MLKHGPSIHLLDRAVALTHGSILFIGDRYRSILKFFGPLRVGLEITFDMFMFGDLELTCAGSVAPSFWLALYFQ